MLGQSYLNAELGLGSPNPPGPPNPWQVISTVIAALAAVASLVINWKGNRTLGYAFIAVALIVAVSVFYRPIAASARTRIQNLRGNRVARRSWPEFLRIRETIRNLPERKRLD
jgi:asparagine N-glycosylation enzyme membrane subunit Stt3